MKASMLGRFKRLPPREFGLDEEALQQRAAFVRTLRRQLLDEALRPDEDP